MSNSQARVEAIFAEAAELFASKNAAYGDSWRHNGWRGNLSRIMEKAGRLRNMLWRDGNVLLNGGKEHPRETALDMINTLAFMVVNMDDGVEWGHEPGAREIPPPFDRELEQFRLSYGNPALTRQDLEAMRKDVRSGNRESLDGVWPAGYDQPFNQNHHRLMDPRPLPPEGRVVGYTEQGDEVSAHPVGEQTLVAPHLGELPPPGEEKPSPEPRKRGTAKVTDRGSGPRKVADTPQA